MVEGSKNSVKVHLDEKVIQVPDTLVAMESCLPEDHFLRVHKSFIVAIDKIERIRGNKIFLHQLAIPIGKLYKKDVEQMVADHRP
jgi:DNA-binding LytR/AlgR family response regulator